MPDMQAKHQSEWLAMDAGQKARLESENRIRAERLRKGLAGVWDRLRGEYARRRKQNEMEALFACLPSSVTANSVMRWCIPSSASGRNYRCKSAPPAPVMPSSSVIFTRTPPTIA